MFYLNPDDIFAQVLDTFYDGKRCDSHCRQSQTKLYSVLDNLLVILKKRGGMR